MRDGGWEVCRERVGGWGCLPPMSLGAAVRHDKHSFPWCWLQPRKPLNI